MKKNSYDLTERPTTAQLEAEYDRVRYNNLYQTLLKSTVYTLITVAAIAILIATLWLPVLQIYGDSMAPTMDNGEIVVSIKTTDLKQGDVVAFYFNNSILVKRVIALPGDEVNIDENGTIFVNGDALDEPYVAEPDWGDTNIELPYEVPEGKFFVVGDNRATSVDSRNQAVGCVAQEQLVGKIVFRVWPLNRLGAVD